MKILPAYVLAVTSALASIAPAATKRIVALLAARCGNDMEACRLAFYELPT